MYLFSKRFAVPGHELRAKRTKLYFFQRKKMIIVPKTPCVMKSFSKNKIL